MNDRNQTTDLVPSSNYSSQIKQFEDGLLGFIEQYGLPTGQVLVQVSERLRVFSNVEGVVERIELEQRQRSIYISKFFAAAAAGLFDAALNYFLDRLNSRRSSTLWAETSAKAEKFCLGDRSRSRHSPKKICLMAIAMRAKSSPRRGGPRHSLLGTLLKLLPTLHC